MTAQYLKVDDAIWSQAENSVEAFLDLQCSTGQHITTQKHGNIYNWITKLLDRETNIVQHLCMDYIKSCHYLIQLTSSRQLVNIPVDAATDRTRSLQNAHYLCRQASCWCTEHIKHKHSVLVTPLDIFTGQFKYVQYTEKNSRQKSK